MSLGTAESRRCGETAGELNSAVYPDTPPHDCLVFDIGGTSLRAAHFDVETGALLRCVRSPTPNFHTHGPDGPTIYSALLDAIADAAARLDLLSPATIGVAFAGPVDARSRVLAAPTIWGDTLSGPVDLVGDLARRWPRASIFLDNDVTAAGYRFAQDPAPDFCIITVGSGIGCKLFLDGKPMVGPSARGGEIGHLRVDFRADAPRCDCGGIGHLGALASGRGTLAFARSRVQRWGHAPQPGTLSSEELVAAFRADDPWAVEMVSQPARLLGRTLAAMHLALGIERFVLIGGFALALGEAYRRCIARSAAEATWSNGGDWMAMVELATDDHSGLIGAGRRAAMNAHLG